MSVHTYKDNPKLTLIMKFIDSMNSSMEQDGIVVEHDLTKQQPYLITFIVSQNSG